MNFGFSCDISNMIINSCQTVDNFNYLENLATKKLENRKTKLEMKKEEIIILFLKSWTFYWTYIKKEDNNNDHADTKFILLCEKEFQYCYSRYIEYLESKVEFAKDILYCNIAFEFAKGLHKTELIRKLGDT